MKCENCMFWNRGGIKHESSKSGNNLVAYCRVNAPSVFVLREKVISVHPVTPSGAWCGEWEGIEELAEKEEE